MRNDKVQNFLTNFWNTNIITNFLYILGSADIVEILAPLCDNPNAPNPEGWTPILVATNFGRTDIVQILAPLTENPNAPNAFGLTPIQKAAFHGYSEIVP